MSSCFDAKKANGKPSTSIPYGHTEGSKEKHKRERSKSARNNAQQSENIQKNPAAPIAYEKPLGEQLIWNKKRKRDGDESVDGIPKTKKSKKKRDKQAMPGDVLEVAQNGSPDQIQRITNSNPPARFASSHRERPTPRTPIQSPAPSENSHMSRNISAATRESSSILDESIKAPSPSLLQKRHQTPDAPEKSPATPASIALRASDLAPRFEPSPNCWPDPFMHELRERLQAQVDCQNHIKEAKEDKDMERGLQERARSNAILAVKAARDVLITRKSLQSRYDALFSPMSEELSVSLAWDIAIRGFLKESNHKTDLKLVKATYAFARLYVPRVSSGIFNYMPVFNEKDPDFHVLKVVLAAATEGGSPKGIVPKRNRTPKKKP